MKNDEALLPDLYDNNRYLSEVDFARVVLTIGTVIFRTLNDMSGFLLYRGYAKSGFQSDKYAKKMKEHFSCILLKLAYI